MAGLEDLTDAQKDNRARAAHKLLANKDTATATKRLLMKADPSVHFADVEAEDRAAEIDARVNKRIEEMTASQMQQRAEAERERRHQQARDRGLDPAEVEKAIIDRGIANWDTAMEFCEMQKQSAVPTPSSFEPARFDLPKGTDDWFKNPAKKARDEAYAAISDLQKARQQRRA